MGSESPKSFECQHCHTVVKEPDIFDMPEHKLCGICYRTVYNELHQAEDESKDEPNLTEFDDWDALDFDDRDY